MIHVCSEEVFSDYDDYFVLNIGTNCDDNGLETKKTVKIGDDAIVKKNILMESASPFIFLKQKVLHELKLREAQMKALYFDKKTPVLYRGFTNVTKKI